MEIQRSALIIATDAYQDPGLSQLRAPARDAEELALVLGDPEIGNFDVSTVLNEPAHIISEAIEDFFDDRRRDDLLALHISCHGVKSDNGELYFAAANTKLRRLGATAVSANFVNIQMNRSRSRRVVVFLDCCYSGAFERDMVPRAAVGMDIQDQLGGRGRAVITASSAMEFAFEQGSGEAASLGEIGPSLFTSAIVQGLRTGDADMDQDGLVSLEELYDYVYERVQESTSSQTPKKWVFGMEGELYIARRRGRVTLPSELPAELLNALEQPFPRIRVGVVEELERFLSGRHAGLALAAKLTLERLVVEDDSRMVIDAASAALNRIQRLELSETQVDFGRLALGVDPPQRTVSVRNGAGGDLEITAAASSDRLRVELEGNELTIIPDTSRSGDLQGEILVHFRGESFSIGISGLIEPPPVLSVQPTRLDFGRLLIGEHPEGRRIQVSNKGGGSLEWDHHVEGDFLEARRDDDALVVQPRPVAGRHHGTILIRSNGGEQTVLVTAVIEAPIATPVKKEASPDGTLPRAAQEESLDLVSPPSSEERSIWSRVFGLGSATPGLWSNNRTRVVAGVLAAVVVLVGIVRLGLPDDDADRRGGAPTGASAGADKGGVLRTAVSDFGFTNDFDPTGEYVASAWAIYNALARTLVSTKHIAGVAGNKLFPDLAAAEPEISSDGLKYTFKLKPGIKWAPPLDRDVTSKDVAYAFQRINAAPLVAQYGSYYYGIIKGMDGGAKSAETTISGIETPDDQTIIFNLEQPTGDFLYRLSLPATAPIPREVARCFPKAGGYGRYVISSGPYMISRTDKLDISSCNAMRPISGFNPSKSITLVRNPNYDQATDNTRSNYVDAIKVSVNTNVDDIFSQIQAGTLDSSMIDQPPKPVLQRYLTDPAKKPYLHSNSGDRTWYITMNWITPPFDDIHVRKAANWIMDKQGILQAWGGTTFGEIATHVIPPIVHSDKLTGEYNPYPSEGNRGDEAKAKEEMKQSKYDSNKDGICDASACSNLMMINRNVTPWTDAEAVVVSSLEKIGIKVKPRELASYTAYTTIQTVKNKIPIALNAGWGKDYADPYTFIWAPFDSRSILEAGNVNYPLLGLTAEKAKELGVRIPSGVTIPSVDSDGDACQKIPVTEPDQRNECFADLDKRLMEEAVPWVPYLWVKTITLTGPTVTKFEFDQFSGYISFTQTAVKNRAKID